MESSDCYATWSGPPTEDRGSVASKGKTVGFEKQNSVDQDMKLNITTIQESEEDCSSMSPSRSCVTWTGPPPKLPSSSNGRPRTRSVGCRRSNSIVYSGRGRSLSTVSRSGKRYVKHVARVGSKDETARPPNVVPLFRLNSVLKQPGRRDEEDEEPERQQWDNPIEFLLSCISMSVGLGNVWRFPFTAYENGGGAFLIPYILVLLLVGRPLYFLELALGQFSSSGSVRVWDMVPALGGVGYGQIVATALVSTYYCSLICLSIYYLVVSASPTLPWTVCHESLAEPGRLCIPSGANASALLAENYNLLANQVDILTNSSNLVSNLTTNMTAVSSAEQYFRVGVLKEDTDLSSGLGWPDPTLTGCLAVCWLLIYLTLRNGVASSGKVAYFTAIFPYIVMLTLLVRGLTLPGAGKGLLFFFTPQWEKLASLKVWYAAVTQSFFSLSVGFGTLTTYSSYNKFRHNTAKDALIISFADTFTSLLAGTIIFSILGHLAYTLDKPVDQVVKSGAGLAFVSYPEVLAKFDFAPQLFAVLFFLMLITLGMGSAVGFMSAVTTTICDSFPDVEKKLIAKVCCVIGLCLGLPYVTPGGQVILEMVDFYAGTLLILALASIEIMAMNWIYGTGTIARDINFMLGTELGPYWLTCWGFLCPVLLPLLLTYVLVTQAGVPALPLPLTLGGWIFAFLGLMIVPTHTWLSLRTGDEDDDDEDEERTAFQGDKSLVGDEEKEQKKPSWMERLKLAFQPNASWGPSSIQERRAWEDYKDSHSTREGLPKCCNRN